MPEPPLGPPRLRPGAEAPASRMAIFTDAVIAIVLAIMVLELRLPDSAPDQSLWDGLVLPMAPKLATYAISFATVAIVWVNHHRLLRAVRRSSPRLLWLNNLLLFCLSLVPAATGHLGTHFSEPRAVSIYAVVLGLVTAAFALIRWSAMQGARRNPLFFAYQKKVLLLVLGGCALYAVAAVVAQVSTMAALVLLVLAPGVFFVPLRRPAPPHGAQRGQPGMAPPSGWRRQTMPPGRKPPRQISAEDLAAIERLVPGHKGDS